MSTPRYSPLHLIRTDSAFALTVRSVLAFTFTYTYLFGPSPQVACSMLGVLVATAIISFDTNHRYHRSRSS